MSYFVFTSAMQWVLIGNFNATPLYVLVQDDVLTITSILREVIEHLEDGDSDTDCKYESTQM